MPLLLDLSQALLDTERYPFRRGSQMKAHPRSIDRRAFASGGLVLASASFVRAQANDVPIATSHGVTAHNVVVEKGTFQNRDALKLTEAAGAATNGEDNLALIDGITFENGTIELNIASQPKAGAGQGARGFAGIAFHVAPDKKKFECFYLRPTNGRADDQERRNHSVQYISFPDHPWHKLRAESPSKYESYADLQPAAWTPIRVEVDGVRAKLYVHGATQPTLIVNDLKLGATKGSIALWIGPGTEAWFTGLKVTPA